MIQNNSTQINNFWFDVVMPVLKSEDWHLLTLFLYKNKVSVYDIDNIMAESGVNLSASIKRLESQGLVVIEGDSYRLETDDSKIKIKRKKAKQIKAEIEFETVDTEKLVESVAWQGFLRSVQMPHHIREILWRVYEATGRDKDNPWSNIPDINQWRDEAKTCWQLAEGDMELISRSILELTSKGFMIASPRSLHKSIPILKSRPDKKEENVANVGGWF